MIQNIDELKQRSGKFEMLRWFQCEQQGDVPCARDSHTISIVNNIIWLFGGQDQNENHLNDLFSGELSQELVRVEGKGYHDRRFKIKWNKVQQLQIPNIYNNWPVKRASHSMNVYQSRYLVVIGGETESDELNL